ncbi:MAG: tetratricopeptide repeat protein [Acidobacteriota bacterium]|nr:tetratricopeptide repeat protein [Acidobacteriota bacterium]
MSRRLAHVTLAWLVSPLCLAGTIQDDSPVDLQIITVSTQSQLTEVLAELKSGAGFDEVARRNSNHPTAAGGGYLGRMSIGDLSSDLRRRVEGLTRGSTALFVDPGLGYVVIRNLERRAANQTYAQQALRRGSRDLNQGRSQEAIKQFKTAITLDPRSAGAHLMLGYAYRLLGSYRMIGEAKGEFRQALSLDPGNTSARFHLARVYLDLGRIRKARETLEERLEITEKTPELLSLLGEVNRQSGDLRLSIRQNESAAMLDPDLAQAHYYLGLAHLDRGDTEEALSRLDRAIAAKGATSDMILKTGSVYLQEGGLQKALELLRKAVAISPAVPEGRLVLARALRVTGQPDSALAELDAALSHAGGFSASGKYLAFESEVYLEKGRAYDAKGSPADAIRSYLRVLEMDPGHGEAHHRLAGLFASTGDPARSRDHASRAKKSGYTEPAVGR